MHSIGPSPPPHLAKRGRDDEDGRYSSPESGDKRRRVLGPAAPPSASSPRRNVGPALPPGLDSRASSEESGTRPAPPPATKPRRVTGPALPPALLDERPPNPPESDSNSSDDDFGPAPPPAGMHRTIQGHDDSHVQASAFDIEPQFAEKAQKSQRDEWMTVPPTQDDLAARMDPTKLRARKFNTGKSAGGSGGMSVAWTETPEQKLKRLQDEAMGISTSSLVPRPQQESRRSKEEEKRAQRMREKIHASRGKSLVEQHQEKGTGKEEEDDPSKRVFNYEKDMAVGGKINDKQRREMLNKSKGFGDRFSSGSYL